jgi:hypothetical protein
VKLNPNILDGWLNLSNFLLKLFDGTIDNEMKLNENLNDLNILHNIEQNNSNFEISNIYGKKKKSYFLYLLNLFMDGVSVFPGHPIMFYLLGLFSYHISIINNHNDDFHNIDYITNSKNTDSKNTDSKNMDSRNNGGARQSDYLYCAMVYITKSINLKILPDKDILFSFYPYQNEKRISINEGIYELYICL